MDKLFSGATPNAGQSYKNLSPIEFQAVWEHDNEGVIVDVRTAGEYALGHGQDAVNLDFMSPDFTRKIQDLDKDKPYYLYCASGNRSSQAAALMSGTGFKKINNIGGIYNLASAGIKTV